MHKATPLLLAAALGAAMVMTSGSHYAWAARQHEIQRTPASEGLKAYATYEARMQEAERPTLPEGMVIVLPGRGYV